MTNVYTLPTHKQSFEEAGEWIAKLDRGLSADEEAELRSWCAQSAENRNALMKLAASWDKMDCLSRLSELFPRTPRRTASRLLYPAIAVSLAGVIALAWLSSPGGPDMESPGVSRERGAASVNGAYETAVGERSTVRLADQSLLVLNTNSLVKVVYSDKQRLFKLVRGEIGIDVAHDRNRPLRVMAGGRIIQAVGTAFNVQIINDREVELIVTEGQVLVIDSADSAEPTILSRTRPAPAARPSVVSRGERALLGTPTQTIAQVSESAITAQLSWRTGTLIFRGETLADAIVEVSRYTPVKFELADERLRGIRIGGVVKAGDVEGLLATLKDNFNIESQWLDADRVSLKMQ